MLDEDQKIRKMPRIPGDDADLEYAVLPLLFYSDETLLSNFGSASLWLIYLYFGNLSKYIRGRPTEFAAHHLAYIPTVWTTPITVSHVHSLIYLRCQIPDALKDEYKRVYGTAISEEGLRFCKRELFARIWLLLLDDKFMEAYRNGIVVICGDGVARRLFPRIFAYSADYPEK